jgi:hypothetical protein
MIREMLIFIAIIALTLNFQSFDSMVHLANLVSRLPSTVHCGTIAQS